MKEDSQFIAKGQPDFCGEGVNMAKQGEGAVLLNDLEEDPSLCSCQTRLMVLVTRSYNCESAARRDKRGGALAWRDCLVQPTIANSPTYPANQVCERSDQEIDVI